MKTARVLRALYNKNIERYQFVVEFNPPRDVSRSGVSGDVILLPKSAGKRQLVRYALVSAVDNSTAAFELRNSSYELGEEWGDLFAESIGTLPPREFLAALGFFVEDPRGLLGLGAKRSALKTAGIAVGGLALFGGLVALASSKK